MNKNKIVKQKKEDIDLLGDDHGKAVHSNKKTNMNLFE